MSLPLLRNGVPFHRNGLPVLQPDGILCVCCGLPIDRCPWEQTCLVEGGVYEFPAKRSLTMTVTGVDNTWSGFWRTVSCVGPQGLAPCCSKLQQDRKISWTINGFGFFNNSWGYIALPPKLYEDCDDVCIQCIMVLPTIFVRVTGTVTEEFTRTYQHNGNCGPDDVGSYSWTRSSNVCGIASLVIDPVGMTARIRLECLNYEGTLAYGGTGDLPEPYDLRIWARKPSECTGYLGEIIDPNSLGTNNQCYNITEPWWHYGGYTECVSQENNVFRVLEQPFPGMPAAGAYASAPSHTCPNVGLFSDFYTGQPWGPCDEYEFSSGDSPGCVLAGASDCAASNPGGAGNTWSYKQFQTNDFSSSWTVNIQNS